jgi:hypothetical protein
MKLASTIPCLCLACGGVSSYVAADVETRSDSQPRTQSTVCESPRYGAEILLGVPDQYRRLTTRLHVRSTHPGRCASWRHPPTNPAQHTDDTISTRLASLQPSFRPSCEHGKDEICPPCDASSRRPPAVAASLRHPSASCLMTTPSHAHSPSLPTHPYCHE